VTPDERADSYAEIAVRLPVMVRDEDPAEVHRWVRNLLTVVAARDGRELSEQDWLSLVVVLAAAVPVDVEWLKLVRWAACGETLPPQLEPASLTVDEKQVEAKRLRDEGMPWEHIARTLGTDARTVKKWLGVEGTQRAVASVDELEAKWKQNRAAVAAMDGAPERLVAAKTGLSVRQVSRIRKSLRQEESEAA
jgi:hypothetical protein